MNTLRLTASLIAEHNVELNLIADYHPWRLGGREYGCLRGSC